VRGNDMDGDKLAMGRSGFFDEVMRFYDKYMGVAEPAVQDPPFAIQSVTTGKWRPELAWPPADVHKETTDLLPGTYSDSNPQSSRSSADGVWTVSKPLENDAHMAGAAKVIADVSATAPRANLVADLYDVDSAGKAVLVGRQGSLIRNNGPVTLNLMSADWKFVKGHRIAVRLTNNNFDWWIAAIPTQQTVTVYGGEVTLPLLTYKRTQTIQGDSGTTRAAWMGNTATVPPAALTAAIPFNVGEPLKDMPGDMKSKLEKFD
jgi:predicted acyl esterase